MQQSVPTICVPLPSGTVQGSPVELQALAEHIRRELRRQVVLTEPATSYQIWLPTGDRLVGAAVVLDRLADRLARAAAAPVAEERARVKPDGVSFVAPPTTKPTWASLAVETERVTQLLPDLATTGTGVGLNDPTDPYAAPGAGWYQYWGCIWAPDYTTPNQGRIQALQRYFWSPERRLQDGWFAATAEVEVYAATILQAGCLLAVVEDVELATDEVLVLRWNGAALPTLFLDPNRVQLAQWLAAHPGEGLPPIPHQTWCRLNRTKQP